MAIYTTKNFGMLTAEPLDSKRVMAENQWIADDTAHFSYPGQLYYDPETGWFNMYGKDIDNPNYNTYFTAFAINTDGIYIGTSGVNIACTRPEIYMTSNNSQNPIMEPVIYMYGSEYMAIYGSDLIEIFNPGTDATLFNASQDYIISNRLQYIFGISNEITSNTYNEVVSMFGTGLKTNNPGINQFIIGQYNKVENYDVFQIGSGSSDSNRSNVFSVDMDGVVTASEIRATAISSKTDTNWTRDILTAVTYVNLTTPDPSTVDTYEYTVSSLPGNTIIDKVVIKVDEVFEDGELLDIFTMKNNKKTYVIKDYPISKIPAGSLAIENMFTEVDNSFIYVWRHGIDYTKLPGYEETMESGLIYGDFSGSVNIYLSTSSNIITLTY